MPLRTQKPDPVSGQTKKSVFLVSLGCDKNRVDAERMLGLLSRDYRVTDAEDEADCIVINTCCFIQEATEESIQTILDLAALRREGKCRSLIVTGCLAERYREEILTEIPEVDAIVGTHSYKEIVHVIQEVEKGETPVLLDPASPYTEKEPPRRLSFGGFFAYLKIAEGCSRHCTYCVIPSVRGPYHSVPFEDLLEEAEALVQQGVRELILVAQDTARYGTDLYGKKRLPELLRALCRISDLKWVRLLYVYPEEIDAELIRVMAEEPKICKYLDMPIQHADDRVLRRMGRKTTRAALEKTIASLREAMPDIALRTTLITGFPGETEEEHQTQLAFLKAQRFARLGVFPYSQEDGTPAARLPEQHSAETKARRQEELMLAQQEISLACGEERVGEILEVLVEGALPEEGIWVGRTYADAPDVDGLCFLQSADPLQSGDFVRARITGAAEYDLTGEVCDVE